MVSDIQSHIHILLISSGLLCYNIARIKLMRCYADNVVYTSTK